MCSGIAAHRATSDCSSTASSCVRIRGEPAQERQPTAHAAQGSPGGQAESHADQSLLGFGGRRPAGPVRAALRPPWAVAAVPGPERATARVRGRPLCCGMPLRTPSPVAGSAAAGPSSIARTNHRGPSTPRNRTGDVRPRPSGCRRAQCRTGHPRAPWRTRAADDRLADLVADVVPDALVARRGEDAELHLAVAMVSVDRMTCCASFMSRRISTPGRTGTLQRTKIDARPTRRPEHRARRTGPVVGSGSSRWRTSQGGVASILDCSVRFCRRRNAIRFLPLLPDQCRSAPRAPPGRTVSPAAAHRLGSTSTSTKLPASTRWITSWAIRSPRRSTTGVVRS